MFWCFWICPLQSSFSLPPPRSLPCHSARAAWDVVVPSRREKPEANREGDWTRDEEELGGGCHHDNYVFLLALVSQTSSDSQSGGNTHTDTQSHSCSHSHLLEGKPNKDSYTQREGAGGKRREGSGLDDFVNLEKKKKHRETNKREKRQKKWERWKQVGQKGACTKVTSRPQAIKWRLVPSSQEHPSHGWG